MKRLLSLLLCLLMCLSLFPAAFAENAEDELSEETISTLIEDAVEEQSEENIAQQTEEEPLEEIVFDDPVADEFVEPDEEVLSEETEFPLDGAYSGSCGDNLTWTLDDAGTLTISGTGAMMDYYYYNRVPWYFCSSLIKSVIINSGVTSIGDYAFYDCGSLTSVTISNSVTSIGYQAFCNCNNLKSIAIPNSVTSIGYYAFESCSSMTSVTIPNSVTYINHGTFYGCSSLISITIPNSVTYIGDYAFYECSSLKSITIPNSVTYIGEFAFSYCSSLTSVTIGNSVTSIGDYSFYLCSSLTSVTIGNSVTYIGHHAFYQCSSLTSVTIPNGVTSIGNYAFNDCTSLKSITIPNSVTYIGDYAFNYCDSLNTVYYTGTQQQWNEISINMGNSNLIIANIIYNYIPAIVTPAPGTEKKKITVMINRYSSWDKKEDYVLCKGATVTAQGVDYPTDKNGVAMVLLGDGGITVSMKDYVTQTLTPEQLEKSCTVRLQKVGNEAILKALWIGNTDVLHEEQSIHPRSDSEFSVKPEIDWGSAGEGRLCLWQEGVEKALNANTANTVKLAHSFDVSKPIYLVVSNAEGKQVRKELKIKSSLDEGLSGFSFSIGDKLKFKLPSSAGPLAGKELSIDLGSSSRVPVEVVQENGKVYVAIGLNFPFSSDNRDDDLKKKQVEDFSSSCKNFLKCLEDYQTDKRRYDAVRGFMKGYGDRISKYNGSFTQKCSISIMGFAEGYMDDNNKFVLTSSGGLICLDGKEEWQQQFLLGPVPLFWEISFGAKLESQFNLYLNNEIKEFTPDISINGEISLSGGIGLGFPKTLNVKAGLEGALKPRYDLKLGRTDYFQLKAALDWYVKLKALWFSHEWGDTIVEGTWYEYPKPLSKSYAAPPHNMYDTSQYVKDNLSALPKTYARNGAANPASSDPVPVSNAYEGADPQIAYFSDGSCLAVWIGLNASFSGSDGLNLYYCFYDTDGGKYGPYVVESDASADAYPSLKVINDTAYLVWTDACSPTDSYQTLDEVAGLMDISAAVFDRDTKQFATSAITYGSGTLNVNPLICGDENGIFAVWLRNGGNHWFGLSGGNSIMYSCYSGGTWSAAAAMASGLGPVVDFSAYASGGVCKLAFTMDMDGDLNTSEDMEVFAEGAQLSSNDWVDSGVYYDDMGVLYWYSGGSIISGGVPIISGIDSDRFEVVSNNMGMRALVYGKSNGLASSLYAAYFNGSGWGSPIPVSSGNTTIPYFSPALSDNGTLSILMLSLPVVGDYGSENPYGVPSLNWFNAPQSCNLKVQDVSSDNSYYAIGKELPISATLINTGGLTIPELSISLRDEDGVCVYEELRTVDLLSGQSMSIEIKYPVEKVYQEQKLTLSITAKDMLETVTTDNNAELVLGWSDISVEEVFWSINDTGNYIIQANIVNRGYTAQDNIVVNLHAGTESGDIVDTLTLSKLEAFMMEGVSFAIPADSSGVYYVCIEPLEDDNNYGNNSGFTVIRLLSGQVTRGACGESLSWILFDGGELEIIGSGNMSDYEKAIDEESGKEYSTAPWTAFPVKTLILSAELTSIGDYAFYDCSSLTDIYYTGGSQWSNINIGTGNDPLISAELHIPGDIDGNATVNTKDFITLMKLLAGEEDLIYDEKVLDVNGDGSVGTKDFITLMKYVAGFPNIILH